MHDSLIPLQLLPPGHVAQIDQLVGDAAGVHRLEEMGLRIGTRVEMVRAGTPCIVKLSGHTLRLRGGNLLQVLVRTENVA
jgi:ferrous iron transport protein A